MYGKGFFKSDILFQFCQFAAFTQSQKTSISDSASEAEESESPASASSRTTLEACFFGLNGDQSLGFQDFSNFVAGTLFRLAS